MATMVVKNAAGGNETVEKPLSPGRAGATASRPVVLSSEDLALIANSANQALINAILGDLDGAALTDPAEASGAIVQFIRGLHVQGAKGRFLTDVNGVALDVADEYLGQVGGNTPRIVQTMVRASNATQYSLGDLIGNSTTGASVVPILFDMTRAPVAIDAKRSGRISGCRCTVTAASGTIVLPKFNLYLFRPETNIPFTAGSYPADNAAFNIPAAAMEELVCAFEFLDTDWLNQAGGSTAVGTRIWQAAPLKPTPSGRSRAYAPFNLATLAGNNLIGLMQAQNTWNPGAIANTFDFALDVDLD